MATLLELARAAAAEIGVVKPPSLVGSADQTAEMLLAAAKAEGQALYRAHNWSILHREHVFTTVASQDNYPVPDDFGRLTQSTAWDRHTFRQMRGTYSPAQWQHIKSGLTVTPGITRGIRVLVGPRAGSVLVDPAPAADGEELVYEYVSRDWCESDAGAGQPGWMADTDLPRLDEEVFRLGLLWRAKRAFGLAYADDRADYDVALKAAIQADFALPVVSMVRRPWTPRANLLDGSWPL